MHALRRSLARAAPLQAVRFSSSSVAARARPSLLRHGAALKPLSSSSSLATPRLAATFHGSAVHRDEARGAVNDELVAKLQNEIALEEDMKEDDDLSANIKEYLENSPFEIEDKPGQQEVVLRRSFGDEQIRVTFTTADLNNNVSSADDIEDNAIYDGDVDPLTEGQSGGANTKGAVPQDRTPDGNVRATPEELEDEYDDADQQQGFPARANIRIERPSKGALAIDATVQDGDFLIDDLSHFPTADLADPQTAEQSWSRQNLYAGPPFSNLDEDLQILLERYLDERGINTRMALFIPDYIDHKEQKEYIRWLKNVKSFVE